MAGTGRGIRIAIGMVALLGFGHGGEAATEPEPRPLVLWLSLDGVRHDQPARVGLPVFARLEREGVRAAGLRPVDPSTTFPNHVSQATCAHPARHGIAGNRFRDRERGVFDYAADASWIRAEPLWVSAERQGVRAASYFWVGSETPWRGRAASDRRSPFDAGIGEQAKVDQILAWIDRPPESRPGLIMSWWRGSDRAGHRFGPQAAGVDEALRAQGRPLARLLAELDRRRAWSYTTLIVSSDHGMARATHAIDVAGALARARVKHEIHSGGAVAYVHLLERGESLEREGGFRRAQAALEALPGHRVLTSTTAAARGRYGPLDRIGDFVLVAEPPYYYAAEGRGERVLLALQAWWYGGRGVHGYDAGQPEMHGIFFAVGRGVPAGQRLGTVSALDIAPTVSRLLGIDPPADCEGQALPGIGQTGHAPERGGESSSSAR